ncbi:MAG: hypothetical protein A3I66_10610 [Burkholderiales bacterium RIFCSPLOWO2_02_FULL_57_36]|nr:MAG: hypothetical protein A3I66_10610 [Burkholderiales bacterium RIFCSPLOWO2_02_FULL_57_36]
METRIQSTNVPEFIQLNENPAYPDEVRISHYDNEVPAFAGPEIDRLYGHLYCSPSYFVVANELAGASTYVARKGDDPVAMLLYKRSENEVTVISDYVKIDEQEIRRFADWVFNSFKPVKVVSFRKLQAAIHDLAYPWHAVTCTEDMVVTLPPTVKEYETAVGKNMRRNIKRYTNALVKDFPSYRYRLYLEAEVSEQHIRDIIALSCTRMKSKNIVPRFNEEETQWIVDFAKKCGIVGVATVDGRVCAGAIGFRMGENCFMHVIAHDVKFNDYSLGILCYYHTICESIARGAKNFHLLQGRYGYKYRLLAQRQDLIHLDIYRSRWHALAHARRIFGMEVRGRIRLMKQWLLHDVERAEGRAYRLLGKAVNSLRSMKRSSQSSAIE